MSEPEQGPSAAFKDTVWDGLASTVFLGFTLLGQWCLGHLKDQSILVKMTLIVMELGSFLTAAYYAVMTARKVVRQSKELGRDLGIAAVLSALRRSDRRQVLMRVGLAMVVATALVLAAITAVLLGRLVEDPRLPVVGIVGLGFAGLVSAMLRNYADRVPRWAPRGALVLGLSLLILGVYFYDNGIDPIDLLLRFFGVA